MSHSQQASCTKSSCICETAPEPREQPAVSVSQCWKELERRAAGQTPEPGSERDVIFNRRIADIKQCARALIADRKAARAAAPEAADRKFIDVVIDFGGDDAELIESDVIDYVLAAYMSTGDSEFLFI